MQERYLECCLLVVKTLHPRRAICPQTLGSKVQLCGSFLAERLQHVSNINSIHITIQISEAESKVLQQVIIIVLPYTRLGSSCRLDGHTRMQILFFIACIRNVQISLPAFSADFRLEYSGYTQGRLLKIGFVLDKVL